MSRKKRVLRRLHLVESDLQKTAKTNSKAMWGVVSKGLMSARDIWQEGLTEKTYLAYGEIYDGLILASQQMAASEEKSIEADTISLCRELLQYLIGQTEQETAVKKDIVFLPYKASMWDSLESVWKAAYADKEHCNAYVMPIPYCDRNPDGSVAEWHCERDLFPKYVPTLDWQKVDLMAWHPDIIFYHYPYDDYNRVTSLDGRYYSRNLRQCADKLVYIPYFVLDEPCTEESVEHFVTTQGVLNADKVIVQSEAMRELYINILMKRTNQPDRAYWEERISGAGSPKIEKVLTSKKEDFEMPEKWKKLVEGKKVILYNTSLTAMLQNSDKVCDKLRYVFDVFRNRDDVVLWWRPHPLMKSTFHSMRPQYESEYLNLEKQYIEEGWGIYDDTADLHRAICWSDAYYGDMSSVVNLYRITEKPITLVKWNWNIRNIDIHEDFSYVIDATSSVIYQIHLESGNINKIGYIPSKYISTEYPYAMICKIGEKLIILPEQERRILEYDLDEKRFQEALVLENQYSISVWRTFLSCIRTCNSIYFIGHHQGEIVKYDLQRQRYTNIEIDKKTRRAILSDSEYRDGMKQGWFGYAYRYGDGILVPIVHSNKLLRLDINDDSITVHTIRGIRSIQDMVWDKKYFYFLQLNGEVYRYVYQKEWDWIQDIEYSSHVCDTRIFPYYFIVSLSDKLVLYPGVCGETTVLSKIDGRCTCRCPTDQTWICIQKNPNGEYVGFSHGNRGNYIHIINGKNEKIIQVPYHLITDVKHDTDRLLCKICNKTIKDHNVIIGATIYEMM